MGDLAGGRLSVAADAGTWLGGGGDRPAPAAANHLAGGLHLLLSAGGAEKGIS